MMISAIVKIGGATLALAALTLGSASASETASVSGYAYDCAGEKPLAAATVVFRSHGFERHVKTSQSGRFVALGLDEGVYDVALEEVAVPVRGDVGSRSAPTRTVWLSATRTLRLDPNDNVAMRIGVGAQSGVLGHVVSLQCDPQHVPVVQDAINRTTVVSRSR